MMAVPKPEALVQAEIHAMRQLSDAVSNQSRQFADAMSAQTRAMEALATKLDDVRERVIRLESARHDIEIERVRQEVERIRKGVDGAIAEAAKEVGELDDRLRSLEAQRDTALGMVSFGAWLTRNTPWLISLLVVGAAGLGAGKITGQ